jgi:intracellular septation protein
VNQLLDFLPIAFFVAVFFGTAAPDNILWATAALMVGVTLQLGAYWLLKKPISGQLKFTFWASIILGGLTLILRDATFIQWKPTVVNWTLALVLLGSDLLLNRNLLKSLLGQQLQAPDNVWRNLNFGWSAGFTLAGILNLLVAWNYSMEFWVTYKLVGGFGLTLLYIILTVVYLARLGHLKDPQADISAEAASAEVTPNDHKP